MSLIFIVRVSHGEFYRNYQGVSHAKWPKPIMSARQPRPTASFAARSKRWTSRAPRSEPMGPQNARRNYERYLALARAEAQCGNTSGQRTTTCTPNIILGRCPGSENERKSLPCDGRLWSARPGMFRFEATAHNFQGFLVYLVWVAACSPSQFRIELNSPAAWCFG